MAALRVENRRNGTNEINFADMNGKILIETEMSSVLEWFNEPILVQRNRANSWQRNVEYCQLFEPD